MNKKVNPYSKRWKIIYKLYPPIIRTLEKLKFHTGRQPFIIGFLKEGLNQSDLKNYLIDNDFELAILAWKDEQEIFSLRKTDNKIFQYHIRLHSDGEIRGHYEYSPEGSPLKHVLEKGLEQKSDFFINLLKDYLKD